MMAGVGHHWPVEWSGRWKSNPPNRSESSTCINQISCLRARRSGAVELRAHYASSSADDGPFEPERFPRRRGAQTPFA